MRAAKKIGYARVSTTAQKLDRQLGALRAEDCDTIFPEKASARSIKVRPELERAIDALGTNDVFVIAEWDRATRSMMDGIAIMQRVADRGAMVKVLDKPWLDLATPMDKGKRCADGPPGAFLPKVPRDAWSYQPARLERDHFHKSHGLRWSNAPKEYGKHKTLYNHWKRWSNKDIFAEMLFGWPLIMVRRKRS